MVVVLNHVAAVNALVATALVKIKMYGGVTLFTVFCLILMVCDTAVHVMIQMYFEGHSAFDDKYDDFNGIE